MRVFCSVTLAHSKHSPLPPAHPPPKAHSTNSCWPLLEPGALLKNLLLKPVEYNDDDSEIESLSREVPISFHTYFLDLFDEQSCALGFNASNSSFFVSVSH